MKLTQVFLYVTLVALTLHNEAFAQFKICINSEIYKGTSCKVFDDRQSFEKWYNGNANKGDFGANEKIKDFREGEPETGFESCEDVVIEDSSMFSFLGIGDTFKRCTYAPKWHIVDKQGNQVDPRNFDMDNSDHLQDISAEVAAQKAAQEVKKNKLKELRVKEVLTPQEMQEALKLLLERG